MIKPLNVMTNLMGEEMIMIKVIGMEREDLPDIVGVEIGLPDKVGIEIKEVGDLLEILEVPVIDLKGLVGNLGPLLLTITLATGQVLETGHDQEIGQIS